MAKEKKVLTPEQEAHREAARMRYKASLLRLEADELDEDAEKLAPRIPAPPVVIGRTQSEVNEDAARKLGA